MYDLREATSDTELRPGPNLLVAELTMTVKRDLALRMLAAGSDRRGRWW